MEGEVLLEEEGSKGSTGRRKGGSRQCCYGAASAGGEKRGGVEEVLWPEHRSSVELRWGAAVGVLELTKSKKDGAHWLHASVRLGKEKSSCWGLRLGGELLILEGEEGSRKHSKEDMGRGSSAWGRTSWSMGRQRRCMHGSSTRKAWAGAAAAAGGRMLGMGAFVGGGRENRREREVEGCWFLKKEGRRERRAAQDGGASNQHAAAAWGDARSRPGWRGWGRRSRAERWEGEAAGRATGILGMGHAARVMGWDAFES